MERAPEGEQRPAQPGGLGPVEGALQRRRRAVVVGGRLVRERVDDPALHRRRRLVGVELRRPRADRRARRRRLSFGQLQLREHHRGVQRPRRLGARLAGHEPQRLLAVAEPGPEHRLAGGEVVAPGGEQGKVAELLGARPEDGQRRLELAAGGQHLRVEQREAGAQRPLLREGQRLAGARERAGGVVAPVPEELRGRQRESRRRRPATSAPTRTARRGRARRAPAGGAHVVVRRRGQQGEMGAGHQHEPVVAGLGRAPSRACSRCAPAASSAPVHSSAMPRCSSASARRSASTASRSSRPASASA